MSAIHGRKKREVFLKDPMMLIILLLCLPLSQGANFKQAFQNQDFGLIIIIKYLCSKRIRGKPTDESKLDDLT